MEWIEAKIETKTEAVDFVCAMLMSVGVNEVQIDDLDDMKKFLQENKSQWDYVDDELWNAKDENCYVTFYISNDLYGHENITSVKEAIGRLKTVEPKVDLGSLELNLVNVDDEDWINNWKKYYKPFEVGEKIVIRPVWENYTNDNKIVFNINPGHVFGTGLHETTKLCIEQLEKFTNNKSVVLDLGCGSGILFIISLLLGAKNATAIDIDDNAKNIATENAELNFIDSEKYKLMCGNILENESLQSEVKIKKYDIVVANIVADVIISITPLVKDVLEADGVFISCGIIKGREDNVRKNLLEAGFTIVGAFYKEDWVCIVSKIETSGDVNA
jgi:ribosomal protein L11 methyltransferase